jgi:hypothetical protein
MMSLGQNYVYVHIGNSPITWWVRHWYAVNFKCEMMGLAMNVLGWKSEGISWVSLIWCYGKEENCARIVHHQVWISGRYHVISIYTLVTWPNYTASYPRRLRVRISNLTFLIFLSPCTWIQESYLEWALIYLEEYSLWSYNSIIL